MSNPTRSKLLGLVSAGLLASLAAPAKGEVRLARIFGSHMVLQRDMPLPIWGWAEPGEKVTVGLAGQNATAVAGADGKWEVRLAALPAGGPYELTATGRNTVRLDDILMGEVWRCSGQSNREWGVGMQPSGKEIIAAADHPTIRLFNVAHGFSYEPKADLPQMGAVWQPNPRVKLQPVHLEREKNDGVWRPCSPASIDMVGWNGFSCAAYFFARDLQEKLHVPIGLIQASYGGAKLAPFVPLEGLGLVPSRQAIATHFEKFVKLHGDVQAWYPTVIFNHMIHPLVPLAFRGALWHQGESDVGPVEGLPYFEGLKSLIGGWRKVWGEGDFPFYFVMTDPYRDWKGNELPYHWMSQFAALSIPNTGYVVTTDCGAPWDLHAQNKDIVGHRLALWALAKTYGFTDLVYTGQLYQGIKVEGPAIRVQFDGVGSGLSSRDGRELTHFEIAGEDHAFVSANAAIGRL